MWEPLRSNFLKYYLSKDYFDSADAEQSFFGDAVHVNTQNGNNISSKLYDKSNLNL